MNLAPSVLQACAMRVARLEADGVPLPGPKNLYVSNGLVELTFTEELEKGIDITQTNACGDICATFRGPDLLKRVILNMHLCPYDPELFELLRGGSVLTSGQAEGYAAPAVGVDPAPNGVSIEIWCKRYLNGSPDSTWPYERFVFPRTKWAFGQRKMDNGFQIAVLDGYGTENPNWFNGPANDWPVASNKCYQSLPTATLPASSVGYQTLVGS